MTSTAESERVFVPFALERWFAAQPRPSVCDLSASGAIPLALDELLAVASAGERVDFARSSLGYGPGDGSKALRSIIAQRYTGVRASDVVVTCGAIEALHLSMSAIVSAGDEVIVQRPMYPAAAGIARALGARVVPWDLEERCGYRANVDSLARLLTPATRLVAITQPNNPTGVVLEHDELGALVDLIDPLGAWLLSDEVYRDLALEPGLAAVSAAERYARAISVGDVTKPFGLGGLRVGWLVTHDADLRERIQARRDYTTLSVPTLSDALARIALRHSAELLAQPIANGRENLRALAAMAARDHALSFVPPRGGLTAFVGVNGAAALQRRLAAAGILVVPGELFDCPGQLRVWLGGSTGEFAIALAEIERLLSG
ncbi:MAG: aminotransferase class I/II-fold pyridoxal phosphate-dependent enzyme [Chloroflexota bacterium]|nr:aminotransferase class I/II-fold pyridoxal phosphate-dependent enzyme [Chloroflexota bacterium]